MCIQIMMPVSEGVDMGGHSGILEFKVSFLSLLMKHQLTAQMNALEDDQLIE